MGLILRVKILNAKLCEWKLDHKIFCGGKVLKTVRRELSLLQELFLQEFAYRQLPWDHLISMSLLDDKMQ